MTGSRKQSGFYATLGVVFLMFALALFSGVILNGDQLIQLSWIVTILSGLFFGANSIEHMANKSKPGA